MLTRQSVILSLLQADIRSNLLTLIPQITLRKGEVRIALDPSCLIAYLKGKLHPETTSPLEHPIKLTIKAQILHSGSGTKLYIESDNPAPNPALVQLIVKVQQLQDLLFESQENSLAALALKSGHSGS